MSKDTGVGKEGMDAIFKSMESLPNHAIFSFGSGDEERPVGVISFSLKGFGFGEVTFVTHEGKTFVDAEGMGPVRLHQIFSQLLLDAVFDSDKDAEKHRLFNEVMKRRCGYGCDICNVETENEKT